MSNTTLTRPQFLTNLYTKPIPPGTLVVTKCEKESGGFRIKKGSVGTAVHRVDGLERAAILVRFPSNHEIVYWRNEVLPQRESFRAQACLDSVSPETIQDCIVFRALMGSRAYGMDTPDSDFDIKGMFALPTDCFLGVYMYKDEVRTKVEPEGQAKTESVYSELGKIVRLALSGNADVIELGVSPGIEFCHPVIQPLIDNWTHLFASKQVFASYRGYAIHQFELLQKDIENGEVRWKHAAHLLRLLHSGAHCLETGEIMVRPEPEWSEMLKQIRSGLISLEEWEKLRLETEIKFEMAFEQSKLPEYGKINEANRILTNIRNEVQSMGWKLRPYYENQENRNESSE